MALYIAVCDDNAADRKQIERLLDRENSFQKSNGNPLYFDSFGSKDSLMKTPNRYNLFLITASEDSELNGIAIANEIKQAGIDALIVMMCSRGDRRILQVPVLLRKTSRSQLLIYQNL